jgi:hypothetical protein
MEVEQGVPLFLSQLSATLKEVAIDKPEKSVPQSPSKTPAIAKSAAEHGLNLFKFGFTIEQVVHDYGDVCQAVTELAEERGTTLSIAEFHTLNRCLDDAIAGAVSSWSQERDRKQADKTSDKVLRALGTLVDQAKTTFDVLRDGRVAAGGATGNLLLRALAEMRAVIDKADAK